MGHRVRALVVGSLLLSGCAAATASIPRSFDVLMRLQLREKAGVYPSDWAIVGDSHAAQFEQLKAWATKQGIVIAAAPIAAKNLLGHAQWSSMGWVVLINQDLPANNRLYTLAHELGHVYGPRNLTREQAETVAELVALSVCQGVGLDVAPQTASYLSTNVDLDVQMQTAQVYGAQIDRVVSLLSAALR